MRTKIFRLITAALMLALLMVSSSYALNLKTHTKYTLYIGLSKRPHA